MNQEIPSEKTPLMKDGSKSQSEEPKSPSGLRKLMLFFSAITVEPILLLHSLGRAFEGVFYTNIWVDKVCEIQFNYTAEVCQNIDSGDYPTQQDEVQKMVNMYQVYRRWIEYIPATFVVIALGILSDNKGRRLPILIPMFGTFLESIGYLINSYVWSLPPYFLILSYIPKGFSGSNMAVAMGVYTYMSDSTRKRSRTSRMGILVVMETIGSPGGKYLSTFIYDRYGYVGIFLCPFICQTVSLIYAFIRLKKHPNHHERYEQISPSLWTIFSLANIKKLFMVLFKRGRSARSRICGNLGAICLAMLSRGSTSDPILYTRKKFGWDYYDYTLYSIVQSPVICVGPLFIIPFLSYKLHMEDNMLGFISSCSGIFSKVIIGTAPLGWVMYIAILVDVCGRMTFASTRSALSKLVESNELGAIFALVAAVETITPMISAPLGAFVYNTTLDSFPGAIFIVQAAENVIAACLFVWLLTEFPPQNNQ